MFPLLSKNPSSVTPQSRVTSNLATGEIKPLTVSSGTLIPI